MSGIQSMVRGLPGNQHTKISHPGGKGVTTKVTVVDSPPAVRRRLVGGDPDQGVNNTALRVVNNGVNPVDFSFVLVTPDGNFVLDTGALAPGSEADLEDAWVLRDDETIEVWAIEGAVAVLDVFTTFSDLRSTEVGRGRVQIKASTDATKYEIVPEPTTGRVHVPWGKLSVSYYAIKDIVGAQPAEVTTYLDDDGTVVQCGALQAVSVGSPASPEAVKFAVRALKNQRLLASAVQEAPNGGPGKGDAWAFPVYLIVPDPKVGQAGSSA